MTRRLVSTFGLIVWAMLTFAHVPADAQTTAPGPYYANPSWDQTLTCTTLATCPRFIVLSNMNSAAVLDRETGLVWEKSPSPASAVAWIGVFARCNHLNVGNRIGWRAPTIPELASLIDGDLANSGNPRLPPGHPFTNVPSTLSVLYWSASTLALDASQAWAVSLDNGNVLNRDKSSSIANVWCVRGGQGVDPQ